MRFYRPQDRRSVTNQIGIDVSEIRCSQGVLRIDDPEIMIDLAEPRGAQPSTARDKKTDEKRRHGCAIQKRAVEHPKQKAGSSCELPALRCV